MNCGPIQPGGANFEPNTIESHASWAIDAWFKSHSSQPRYSCDFSGSARLMCADCHCELLPKVNVTSMKVRTIF